MTENEIPNLASAFDSPTYEEGGSFEVDKPVGSMSISPCGRDVVLASRQGLHIIDLDSPWVPPRHLPHHTPWEVADVQWSPFPSRDYWVISTSNQKALVWNLAMSTSQASIEHILHAHTRAITDINFSAHHPDVLATCAVDSFVHCWDLRHPARPALTFCDWFAGATQVKWNRQDSHVIASSHDKFLRIWDDRKGAYPLRSIEAHDTKIYGVDWSRTHANRIVTCSLDKTIKLWDFERQEEEPDRIIRTTFPVWRARHTPFGWGILAMPQRGDHDLHLYDRRPDSDILSADNAKPVHRFEGHHGQVKEFLWRPRGTISDGIDNREFQLVSWGADRMLRLHCVDKETLRGVGYEKGMKVQSKYNFTRKNATYKTFSEVSSKLGSSKSKSGTSGIHNRLRVMNGDDTQGSRLDVAGMGHPQSSNGWENGDFLTARPGMHTKAAARVDIDPITWMKGVKIGKRDAGMERSTMSISSPSLRVDRDWDDFESLGEEIAYVADKFRKVNFYKIDVQNRFVKFSLDGPWGAHGASTYIDCQLSFPSNYPIEQPPAFSVEKTASIDVDIASSLLASVRTIGSVYQARHRGSLEVLTRYLQGEQTIEEIIAWTADELEQSTLIFTEDRDGSSDEEDDLGDFDEKHTDDLELTVSGVLGASNANAIVPLPEACGALWAEDGRLVCFFPPKAEKAQLLVGSMGFAGTIFLSRKKRQMFEGFGSLYTRPAMANKNPMSLETADSGDIESESDSDESYRSSSHSSTSSHLLGSSRHHYNSTYAFRGDHFHQSHTGAGSQRSNGSLSLSRSGQPNAKNIVSIHIIDNIIPAKQSLANQYTISGTDICKHNSTVASREGFFDIADVWSLLDLITRGEVPLETICKADSETPILVLARSAISPLAKRDGVKDHSFNPRIRKGGFDIHSPIKWGHHPMGITHLIRSLFSFFEQLADVQMLAMMAFVLSQYPVISRKSAEFDQSMDPKNGSTGSKDSRALPFAVSQPWYWPSYEIAASIIQPAASPWITISNANLKVEPASITSSIGASSSDLHTPFSTGVTPPSSHKLDRVTLDSSDSSSQMMSTSPEHLRLPQRSNSNLASAFASSLPRAFTFSTSASSSPPSSYAKKRESPLGSYAGGLPIGVTWGATSIFGKLGSAAEERRSKSAIAEPRSAKTKRNSQQAKIKVGFRNQDMFHEEGYASASLLEGVSEWQLRQYRESYAYLLTAWDLPMARTEILQYSKRHVIERKSLEISSVERNTSSMLIGRKTSSTSTIAIEAPALSLENLCIDCSGTIEPNSGSFPSRCHSCRAKAVPLFCTLCDNLVRGRSIPCLACGHALHATCVSVLRSSPLRSVEANKCISGCDCRCIEQVVVEVNWFKEEYTMTSSARSTIKEIAEAESRYWGDDYNMWEDVAYESLAKNLGVAGAKSLKPKASQIWKGREKRGHSMTG